MEIRQPNRREQSSPKVIIGGRVLEVSHPEWTTKEPGKVVSNETTELERANLDSSQARVQDARDSRALRQVRKELRTLQGK